MTDITANNKRIAKNTLFMSVRMVIVLLITLYTSRVILDILGVVDYGIYNVVAGFVAMFTFLNTSLSNGIQRFYNFELGRNGITGAKKVFNTAFFIQVLLALIIVIPTEIIGLWYLHNKMVIPVERMVSAEWVFQFALLTFVMHIVQVPYTASVMAHERMDFYAIMSITNALLTLGSTFLIDVIEVDGLILYGFFLFIISFISLILYMFFCRKSFSEIRFKFYGDKTLFKEMLSFSGWNIFGTLGQMLKDQGVSLVLNLFFGPIVNAARGIANQVNGALQSFVGNITIPVRPQIVQSYSQNNIERSLNLTYTISKLSSFVLLIIALPIIFEIDFILKIWLGENIPTHTSAFIIIIVINAFVLNLNSAISGLVHATGKMQTYQLSGGTISIISVIVVYIVLYIGGYAEYALMAVVMLDVLRQIIAVFILKRLIPKFSINQYFRKVCLPLFMLILLCPIAPLMLYVNMHDDFLRFILVVFMSVFSAISCIYLFCLNRDEKKMVKQLVYKIKCRFYGNEMDTVNKMRK